MWQPDENSKIPRDQKNGTEDYVPAIFKPTKIDQVVEVTEAEARKMTQRLAKEEGIFAGMSSGGALHAALQVAEKIDKGVVVSVVCDRGDRYLSSDLFEN